MHANHDCCSIQTTSDAKTELPAHTPSTDLYEVENGWVLEVDLPGVKQDDLSLHVEDDTLTVDAKTHFGAEGRRFHQEFNTVRFLRRFPLGDQLDLENIAAELTNGLLRVTLPMAEAVKPRKIEVKTNA